MSRSTDERETPWEFFAELDQEFHFALDACATDENTRCAEWFGPDSPYGTAYENALAVPDWHECAQGAIWMNPPYSELMIWVGRAVHEAREHGATVVALLPSSTSAKWFHEYIWDATRHRVRPWVREIRFPTKRLVFGPHDTGAKWPSLVVVFGKKRKGCPLPICLGELPDAPHGIR
jgi:site-specific DNA-methyltransferase (adenine-specific)